MGLVTDWIINLAFWKINKTLWTTIMILRILQLMSLRIVGLFIEKLQVWAEFQLFLIKVGKPIFIKNPKITLVTSKQTRMPVILYMSSSNRLL
jgi:hypothetical protein